MKDFKEAYQVLAPLRERPLPVEDRSQAARAQVLRRLNELLASVPQPTARRPTARRWALVAGLASAIAAAATWTFLHETPPKAELVMLELKPHGHVSLSLAEGQTQVEVAARTRVPASGHLTTSHDSGVELVTPTGLRVTVAADSEISLSELGDVSNGVLRLTRGAVECRVPKQAPGRSFSVATPDTAISVRGTVFSVELTPDSLEHRTCVRVSEGVVVVRRSRSVEELQPGESSGCDTTTPITMPSPTPAANTPPKAEKKASALEAKAGIARAVGSLAAESALLRQALLAEQGGDLAAASRAVDTLLSRYPQSALASEARHVRLRLSRKQAR